MASRLDILLSENNGKLAIAEYVRLQDAGEPIPDEVHRFIDAAFRRHLAGETLDKAFGLKRGRGNVPTTAAQADTQTGLVIRVLELVDTGACGSEAEAKEIVAAESEAEGGPALRAIEGYIKRDRKWARYLLDVKKQYEMRIAKAKLRK